MTPLRLLFITQKLHAQDAFGVLWANAFVRRGYDVTVVCLEWRPEEMRRALPQGVEPLFALRSFGKERGTGKTAQILAYWRLLSTLRYDRAFIHMAPVWYALGFPWFLLRRTPAYMWYTHYAMQSGVRLFGLLGRRFFCATPQSLPQYAGSPKKMVVGHGIDMAIWPRRENRCADGRQLLMVHRMARSKRVEITLRAMTLLPGFTLDAYGIDAEPAYVAELKALVAELKLGDRVRFRGTVSMRELPELYARHRLILNMASETIDKTMLEAMTCGCYPVTTRGNAAAIGIPAAPAEDTPEALAAFVRAHVESAPVSAEALYRTVEERHSLDALIAKMDAYIMSGR